MAVTRVDRILLSDMTDTKMISAQKLDQRPQTHVATHVIRLLGIIGTDAEMYLIKTALDAGSTAAKRLLVKKLEDITNALSVLCGMTVTTSAAASSTFNAGADINALADFMSSVELGDSVSKTIYPTTAASATGRRA